MISLLKAQLISGKVIIKTDM